MARKIIATTELGRGYEVRLVQHNDGKLGLGEFDYYDVELHIDGCGCVMNLSNKCIGRKSGDHWYNNGIEIMNKMIFMADSIDMAMHNLMCYSRNLLMDSPKAGYEKEWHRENDKAKMLRKWMRDLTEYWVRIVIKPSICEICSQIIYGMGGQMHNGIHRKIQGRFRGESGHNTDWYQVSD